MLWSLLSSSCLNVPTSRGTKSKSNSNTNSVYCIKLYCSVSSVQPGPHTGLPRTYAALRFTLHVGIPTWSAWTDRLISSELWCLIIFWSLWITSGYWPVCHANCHNSWTCALSRKVGKLAEPTGVPSSQLWGSALTQPWVWYSCLLTVWLHSLWLPGQSCSPTVWLHSLWLPG